MNNFEEIRVEYEQLLNHAKKILGLSRWVPFAILMICVLSSVGLATLKPVPEFMTKFMMLLGFGLWLGSLGLFIKLLSGKDLLEFELDLLTTRWADEEAIKIINVRIKFLNCDVSIPSGSKVVNELYSRLSDDSSMSFSETLKISDRKWIFTNQVEKGTL